MNVAIVFDSRTGITQAAAAAMGKILEAQGHACTVQSVAEADPDRVSKADLICVGSWTQGLFIVLQHATRASRQFIKRLGDLRGKKAVVFCTYKLATGSLLAKMASAFEVQGAEVVGRFKYRGPEPTEDFRSFASGTLEARP